MFSSLSDLAYFFINPPISITVPTPVAVAKTGIPAPPDLIFSARVPYGVISNSISPSKYIFSNNLFSPT